jgi:hypothetical protein
MDSRMGNLPGLRRVGVGDEYRGRGRAPAALAAGCWHPAHAATDIPCRRLRPAARSSWFTSHGQWPLASAAAARRTAAQPSAPGASERGAESRTDPSGRGPSYRPAAAAACWVEAAAAGRESRRGTGGQTGTPGSRSRPWSWGRPKGTGVWADWE